MKQKNILKTIQQITDNSKLDSSNYFNDEYAYFIYRKIIRLSEAVYLVTNHLNDNEPLKDKIRNSMIKNSEMSVKFYNIKHNDKIIVLYKELLTGLASAISFLEIAVVTGFINEPNYFLLNRELSALFDSIAGKLRNYSHIKEPLTPSFFDVALEASELRTDKISKGQFIKDINYNKESEPEIIKDKINLNPLNAEKTKVPEKINEQQPIKDISHKGYITSGTVSLRTIEKNSRAKAVLNFLKDNNKSMSINDIAVFLPQYSEKTIQRELSKLIEGGFVEKSGKRRWTFYSIIKRDVV